MPTWLLLNFISNIFPLLEFLNAALALVKQKNLSVSGSDELQEPYAKYFRQQRYYMFPSFAIKLDDTSQGTYIRFDSRDELTSVYFYLDESIEVMRRILKAYLDTTIDVRILQFALENCLRKADDFAPYD